jgi:hypothetical protein
MATKKPEENKIEEANVREEKSSEKKTEVAESKKTTKIQKTYPKKKGELVYYIGPTVKRGLLDNGSTFRGLPKEIEVLQEKYPGIKMLFISKKDYIKAITQVKISGTRFNVLYENAKKSIEKKNAEGR